MRVEYFLKTNISVVEPYIGIRSITNQLLEESALVVKEEKNFLGVLTKNDIVLKKHNLVVDCLSTKKGISTDADVNDALELMRTERTESLPVYKGDEFVGVVQKDDLIEYILEHSNELDSLVKERTQQLEESKKSIEDKLIERTGELEKSNKAQSQLLSILSHDLRAPLANIDGLVEIMMEDSKSKKPGMSPRDAFKTIRVCTQSCLSLVANILDWRKSLDINGLLVRPDKVSIHDLVKDNLHMYEPLAKRKNISIVNNIEPNLFAFADSNAIKTVLRNLISNAIKFTPHDGEVQLSAKLKRSKIEVTVSDTGVGIKADKLSGLFTNANSDSTYGTDNERGLGLGLTLCGNLIEAQGGNIRVKSIEKKGSDFYFTLPQYKMSS